MSSEQIQTVALYGGVAVGAYILLPSLSSVGGKVLGEGIDFIKDTAPKLINASIDTATTIVTTIGGAVAGGASDAFGAIYGLFTPGRETQTQENIQYFGLNNNSQEARDAAGEYTKRHYMKDGKVVDITTPTALASDINQYYVAGFNITSDRQTTELKNLSRVQNNLMHGDYSSYDVKLWESTFHDRPGHAYMRHANQLSPGINHSTPSYYTPDGRPGLIGWPALPADITVYNPQRNR